MILEIVKYGHPALRQKGKRIEKITPEIQKLAEDMMETMYDAKGVGLAAQQIGQALQLAVIDVTGVTDRPSSMSIGGKEVDVEKHMPIVLINPEVTPLGAPVEGPEGCLSFPEIFADITRPESVELRALNEKGEEYRFRCDGLLARAVQHEVDHLNGILFIDRMEPKTKRELKPELEALQAETKEELKR